MTNKQHCAGTYPVSGYTKKNGTEVSSYMRTCGAKHLGSSGTVTGGASNIDNVEPNLKGGVIYTELTDEKINKIRQKELFDVIRAFYLKKFQDSLTGEKASKKQAEIAKQAKIPLTFMEYYQLSLNYDNKKDYDLHNVHTTFGEIDDSMRSFIKEKYKDCDITDSTPVVIVQMGTPLSDALIQSKLFNRELDKHIEMVKNGVAGANNFSLTFSSLEDLDLSLVLGKCNIYNLRYDNYFNAKSGVAVDYYDFLKLGYGSSFFRAGVNAANNNAKIQQDKGELTNYILIMPFFLFENDDI